MQNQKILVTRSERLCGVQFEELEVTETSQNEQGISTLAHVPENLRIPQSLYSSHSLVQTHEKEQG